MIFFFFTTNNLNNFKIKVTFSIEWIVEARFYYFSACGFEERGNRFVHAKESDVVELKVHLSIQKNKSKLRILVLNSFYPLFFFFFKQLANKIN